MSGDMPSVLHKLYDFMGNTSHLVSNEERREGKTAVAFLWLGFCNISTVSLDSKSVSGVHKSDSTTDITCSVWGYMA
jgi:hypothetical protein